MIKKLFSSVKMKINFHLTFWPIKLPPAACLPIGRRQLITSLGQNENKFSFFPRS